MTIQETGISGEMGVRDKLLTDNVPLTYADLIAYALTPTPERELLIPHFSPVAFLAKTRNQEPLSRAEIFDFINGFTSGRIPDYQASSWAAFVIMREKEGLKPLTPEETVNLTLAMAVSGQLLDLSEFAVVADKHSTGGVGDKTTLVVAPLVAACGIPVGKMTGRALGFSGGTVDKLESIPTPQGDLPGFRVDLSTDRFLQQLREIGIVLTGQTADLAPADGKLYALRDVTATVESIPLIAASIMSKKIAGGAHTLVLDVKTGIGTFMKTEAQAIALARQMVDIGQAVGMRCMAQIADMNQPLGHAVGNALEVAEAIATLKGEGPEDFYNHCVETAARMVYLSKKTGTMDEARALVTTRLAQGYGLEKFIQLIEAQGGDPGVVDNPKLLPQTENTESILVAQAGYIAEVNPLKVAMAAVLLGAGREKKGDKIDPAVGIVVHRKVGDQVEPEARLFDVFYNGAERLPQALQMLQAAVSISSEPVEPLPLFHKLIE